MNAYDQETIIINNMPLVKHIAYKYYTEKIGIEYEDLVSFGVMGLIDAYHKFDINRGVKFSTYASIRIASFIIDEIRKQSPVSRSYISKIKEYNKAISELQNKNCRQPSTEEISGYMNISKNEIHNIKIKLSSLSTASLDNVMYDDESEIKLIDTIKDENIIPTSDIIEKKEMIDIMEQAINMLKEKDKLVLSLYYYEGLTLKEIGMVLGVSESRVSQLNSRAIGKLRENMKKLKYID